MFVKLLNNHWFKYSDRYIAWYALSNQSLFLNYFSSLAFHQEGETLRLISAAEDYKLRVWDLRTSSCIAVLEGHFSVVTSMTVDVEDHLLYSASRDNVVIIWNIEKLSKVRTIPVYEVSFFVAKVLCFFKCWKVT